MSNLKAPDRDNKRYQLRWEQGWCRHGCGQFVANPANRFVNGHGAKLLDILVDAYREGVAVFVQSHWRGDDSASWELVAPRAWAAESFTPRGLAWFDWMVAHPAGERPTRAEIEDVLLAAPDSSVEELLTVPAELAADEEYAVGVIEERIEVIAETPEAFGRLQALVDRAAPWESDSSGLLEDLATVREIVEQSLAVERPEDEGRLHDALDRAESALAAARSRVSELEREAAGSRSAVDAYEAALAEMQEELSAAVQPVVVTAAEVDSLSDARVLMAVRGRVRDAAVVLSAAGYQGDAGELWDLASIFKPGVDAVRVRAARRLLGGGA